MRGTGTVAAATAAACSIAAAALAFQGATAGTATGALTVGKNKTPFTVAYARQVDDVEGVRDRGPQKSVHILLANAPVPEKARWDRYQLSHLVRGGKLRAAVALQVDPTTRRTFGATLYSAAARPDGLPLETLLSGHFAKHRFQRLTIDAASASGAVAMTQPEEWPTEREPSPLFRYKAGFRAPLEKQAPVTATMSGRAALDSPQAAVARQICAVMHGKDIAALRRLSGPGTRVLVAYEAMGAAEFWEAAGEIAPSPPRFDALLRRVVVRGGREATVVLQQKSGDSTERYVLRLSLKGDDWKLVD